MRVRSLAKMMLFSARTLGAKQNNSSRALGTDLFSFSVFGFHLDFAYLLEKPAALLSPVVSEHLGQPAVNHAH